MIGLIPERMILAENEFEQTLKNLNQVVTKMKQNFD